MDRAYYKDTLTIVIVDSSQLILYSTEFVVKPSLIIPGAENVVLAPTSRYWSL
jgi:hypothetical protein